jgi:NitT/TauT family transport system permease protein
MPATDQDTVLDAELAGLDALETTSAPRRSRAAVAWSATWPKLAAIAIALVIWQLVVWSGWRDDTILPGPRKVFAALGDQISSGELWTALRITMGRAATGFLVAVVLGSIVGALVARVKVLRVAFGSFITGLQTMPSIAWFPLALVLFKRSEGAILFVVVLGGAPAIANGLISGVDNIPPLLLRAGRVLGAKGMTLFRHVVLPASLPGFVAGLKQGWAFSWRSLMAGELLVIILGKQSIGVQLQAARDLADYDGMMATMVVILIIGIVVDSVLFGTVERTIRRRWGLIDQGR